MTMPHMMNCPHQGEGWCLDCVQRLQAQADEFAERVEKLSAISVAVGRKDWTAAVAAYDEFSRWLVQDRATND